MPTLNELIGVARKITMTPEQAEERRRSFVYGNTHLANDMITREMVDEAAERIAAAGQGALKP